MYRLTFEFPPTGGVIPDQSITTVRLLKYTENIDYLLLATEVIFALFIVYYIIEEIIEIRKNGFKYFRGVWNLLDPTVIAVSEPKMS